MAISPPRLGSLTGAAGSGNLLSGILSAVAPALMGGSRTNVNQSNAQNVSVAVNPSIGVVVGPGQVYGTPSGPASGGASAPGAPQSADTVIPGFDPTYGGFFNGPGTYGSVPSYGTNDIEGYPYGTGVGTPRTTASTGSGMNILMIGALAVGAYFLTKGAA